MGLATMERMVIGKLYPLENKENLKDETFQTDS